MLRLLLTIAILQVPVTSRAQGTLEFRANINQTEPGRPLVSEVMTLSLQGNTLTGSVYDADPRISNVYVVFPGADLYHFIKAPDPMGDWHFGAQLWEEQFNILLRGEAQALVITVDGEPPLAYPTTAPIFQVPEPAATTLLLFAAACWLSRRPTR